MRAHAPLNDNDNDLFHDELVNALPRDADGHADLVADAREAGCEVGRGRGGVRDGEVEEEGGEPAAGGVAVSGERELACERVGGDGIGGRQTGVLEEPAGVQEGGGGRVVLQGELCVNDSDAGGRTDERVTHHLTLLHYRVPCSPIPAGMDDAGSNLLGELASGS